MSLSLPSWLAPRFTAMQRLSRRSLKSFDERSNQNQEFFELSNKKDLRSQMGKKALTLKYKSWKMMSCHQWFADFVARYLAIINSSINFLIYCLVTACRNISYEVKLYHIFITNILVWEPSHTISCSLFILASLTKDSINCLQKNLI